MSLMIRAATGSGPSAMVLRSMLLKRNVDMSGPGTHTVYWGAPGNARNALNARPARNKLQELQTLATGQVKVPTTKESLTPEDFAAQPVWFARKSDHRSGRDLQVVLQADEAQWRREAGWEYFTARVPIKRELRAWAFRGQYLATYEKKMERPAEFTRLGRNHRNGFAFKRIYSGRPRGLPELANAALIALGLDFGAVDVIEEPSGDLTVLEVNTAPGIDSEDMGGAKALADCIARWYSESHG